MTEILFSITNAIALLTWILLIALTPKYREVLYKLCFTLLFPVLGLVYAFLILPNFALTGGGFNSLQSITLLFQNPSVLLAGWIHYLIFDLFVGIYLAKQMDQQKIYKFFQGLILLCTFMFGPLGLLIYFIFIQIKKIISILLDKIYDHIYKDEKGSKIFICTLDSLAFTITLWPILFIVSFIDSRLISDVNIWVKPLKFIYAFSLHLGTILLIIPLLQKKYLENKFLLYSTFIGTYSLVLEIVYIAVQALRGRDSHFNNLTSFESIMYGLMGVGAVLGVWASFLLGVYIYRYAKENISKGLRVGSALGLVLGSILTFIVAGYLGGNGSHFVNPEYKNISLLPFFGWSTIYGDLRVPHFFATHTMQIIPLIGLLSVYVNKKYQVSLIYFVSVIVTLLVAYTFWQALNNIPFISF